MPNLNLKLSPFDRSPSCGLSVVVPCFNEQECLQHLYRKVSEVCRLVTHDYEIVLVDDGSTDLTWSAIKDLRKSDGHVFPIKLSRNHGHQLALSCGLRHCHGDRIFIIDADLQDPPELLPRMMEKMDEGFDIVYGQRKSRAGETKFKLWTAKMFYRLLDKLSDVPIPMDVGDFRLVSRRALDTILEMPERHRFIRGMMSWIGFRQVGIEYHRDARLAGETKYPLKNMVKLAMDAVASFSTRPLSIAMAGSFLMALAGIIILAYAAGSYAFGRAVSGWTSTIGIISLLSSVQLAYLGIIGFYLGRLYEQAKGRPLFIVEEMDPPHFEMAAKKMNEVSSRQNP